MSPRIDDASAARPARSEETRRGGTLSRLAAGRRVERGPESKDSPRAPQRLRASELEATRELAELNDAVSELRVQERGLAVLAGRVDGARELAVKLQDSGQEADGEAFQQALDAFPRGTRTLGVELSGLQADDPDTFETLERAAAELATRREALGQAVVRLATRVQDVRVASENAVAARVEINDADHAQALTERTRELLLARGGDAVGAQGHVSARVALSLLP
jgi:hypothetical protein